LALWVAQINGMRGRTCAKGERFAPVFYVVAEAMLRTSG
jgi:hypothetical protein